MLYLHGLYSVDFTPALERFLGSGSGLSAATVTRLTTQWQEEVRRCDVFRSLPERKESGRPYPRLVVGLHSPGETVWIAQGHCQSDIWKLNLNLGPKPGAEASLPCSFSARWLNGDVGDVFASYVDPFPSEKSVKPVWHEDEPTVSYGDLTTNLAVTPEEVHSGLEGDGLGAV